MNDGFVRIACATPAIEVADCMHNAQEIAALARQAAQAGAAVVLFPELCVTAYTCGDLFLQQALLDEAELALFEIVRQTRGLDLLLVVGLPVRHGAALYNCAAVLCHGRVLGLVPKRHIPNYGEFYELRHFRSGPDAVLTHDLRGQPVPLGSGLVFVHALLPALRIGVEICEDLWVPNPPSASLAMGGATVILNPSASDEVVGKADFRRQLVQSQSARLIAAYAYADAGEGESTTDLVFSGHNLIAENGTLLAESKRYETGLTLADVDVLRLESERRRTTTFPIAPDSLAAIPFSFAIKNLPLERPVSATPFVPKDDAARSERCDEILRMQAQGLATRLRRSKARCATLALSGGLDSTLALIVIARAFDLLGMDRRNILTVTMPGFGTTARTRGNADALAEAYG
ncbi:MAG TPA: NAD(+) synthase, partial [Clostridia bacterium]|nr:NAD(+) synthase [Clostridia bacterium]